MVRACSKTRLERLIETYGHRLKPLDLLKAIILDIYGYRVDRDNIKRELMCSCARAWHGSPAPIVLAVEGSPPKGVVLLPSGFQMKEPVIFYSSARLYACRVDRYYHGQLYEKLLALIALAVKELCNQCLDSYAMDYIGTLLPGDQHVC
jgi:hypothetical protein